MKRNMRASDRALFAGPGVAKLPPAPDDVNERARTTPNEGYMTDFRRVTDQLSVAPQIRVEDVARAAQAGFRTIVNNRPDGEEPGQPTSGEIEAAATAAGLAYVHIPVRGGPTPDQVEAERAYLETAAGPVLAFCRSGTRSIVTWSVGEALAGARPRDELVQLGADAGYDLSGVLPR
jgi:uncharacterized protein (TIGR01244 family)